MLFISEPSEMTWLEAVRMTSSHYMPRQLCSHEPGCYPLVTVHFRVSFIIEGSEGKFFFLPIVGGGYIRSPVAYQSSHTIAT